MKTENEYKNTKTEEQRYSQINSQLQMLRNNITKLDNHKEQFPDAPLLQCLQVGADEWDV